MAAGCTLDKPLRVQNRALDWVIGHRALFCQLEQFELLSHLLELQVQILHLQGHCLIVID